MRTPWCLVAFSLLPLTACEVDLGERTARSGGSFGAIVFREACQRLTYSAEIAANRPIDVSGSTTAALCRGEAALPEDADPTLRALFAKRDDIIKGVDEGVPDRPEDLQSALDGYLRAIQPLQDDGTLRTLMTRSAALLNTMASDDAVLLGLTRLGHLGGIRPAETSGGLLRAVAAAPGFDAFVGASLPLLDAGGIAEHENINLLAAGAFELRHLERSGEAPTSAERTPQLLRRLLTATDAELTRGSDLFVTLRDPRGLPLLTDVVSPYVLEPATGLALANGTGYFLSSDGKRIPYVAPLPEPGGSDVPGVRRDGFGRVLRSDGNLLYQYANLDGSLLFGLLDDAPRLFDDAPAMAGGRPRDMLFGMLQGATLLVGRRDRRQKTASDGVVTYLGFDPADSTLLDLTYAGTQLLRFSPSTSGQDLADVLRGVRTLLKTRDYENALARTTRALLAAADEAKRPIYDGARLPDASTLYDDLVPVVTRLLAVDDGALVEDLLIALGDEHAKNLGPIMAQLADERGYFFMRQLGAMDGLSNLPVACTPDSDESNNGLSPCGVVGEVGHKPDRSAPDSDATLDWRGKISDDPRNNRSVLARLLHMVADSNNGRPFCNGRFAQFFTDDFPGECDMFQLDSVARFFLLSMATPALRARTDTVAKQSASFREAIVNGRACRGVSGDPDASKKCTKLLQYVTDGTSGDSALRGLFGIIGFGRYPDPAPAARAIFMDLSGSMLGPSQLTAQQMLWNWKRDAAGNYTVDAADPDNRKFRDGNGVERLFIDEHNGVLFALEKVHGPATFSDGSTNKYPSDNFFDAMRPLVDAFAKHAECTAKDLAGTCIKKQNATQILVDAMVVLHRHYPSPRSQVRTRDLVASYGSAARPDGAVSYEPLLAQILGGDLLLANAELSPILSNLTVDGMVGSRRVLPLLAQLGRFVFDASYAPPLLYRDRRDMARRNDGQPAGPPTVYYLLADALAKKRALFGTAGNEAAKKAWNDALSDVIDVFMQIKVTPDPLGGPKKSYAFADAHLRPISSLGLDFVVERVLAHKSDLPGFAEKLYTDVQNVVVGPLAPAAIDVGVKLASDAAARATTYALLRQLLDGQNRAARDALAVAAIDAVQLFLDEDDLVPIGRGLASALDPEHGPALPGITLMRRGRELEQASPLVAAPKQVLNRLLVQLFQPSPGGLHPMSRLVDAIAEVNRAHDKVTGRPAAGDFTLEDYRSVLSTTSGFLLEQQRGLSRFLDIIAQRCLPGSDNAGCPAVK